MVSGIFNNEFHFEITYLAPGLRSFVSEDSEQLAGEGRMTARPHHANHATGGLSFGT